METIIMQYDFLHPSINDMYKAQLYQSLYSVNFGHAAGSMGRPGFQSLIQRIIQKFCVPGFPPIHSSGHEMAGMVFDRLLNLSTVMYQMGVMAEGDVYDDLLEFFIAMLTAGPGSSHSDFLAQMTRFDNFSQYLKNLDGDRLTRVVNAFKAVKHNPGPGISKQDHQDALQENYPLLLAEIFEDRHDKDQPEIQQVFLDLYVFFLHHQMNMPPMYELIFDSCLSALNRVYDGFPFKCITDAELYRSCLWNVMEFISHPEFPRSEVVERTTADIVCQLINAMEGELLLEIYGDLVQFAKAVCINQHAEKYDRVLEELKKINTLSTNHIEGNPVLFETWAPVAAETLLAAPHVKTTGEIWAESAIQFICYVPLKREYGKLWIPVVKGFAGWAHYAPVEALDKLIVEDRWKRVLNWKGNIEDSKEVLQLFANADYTFSGLKLHGDSFFERYVIHKTGDIVYSLREQMKSVSDSIEVEVAEIAFMALEKNRRVKLMFHMMEKACAGIYFMSDKTLMCSYLDRFYLLLEIEDYPWDRGLSIRCAERVISELIGSFSLRGLQHTTPEVDMKFNKIFLYAMEEGREFISLEKNCLNIYGKIATNILHQWVRLHVELNTVEKLQPVLPSIHRLLVHEEDEIRTEMQSIMSDIGVKAKELLNNSSSVQKTLDLFIQNPSNKLLDTLEATYENAPDQLASRFSELMKAFCKIKETRSYFLQAVFFKKIVQTQPKIFTKPGILKMIFEHHYMDREANPYVLQFIDEFSKVYPESLKPFLESHLLKPELVKDEAVGFHGYALTRIAAKCKEKAQLIYDYFASEMKKKSNNELKVAFALSGLTGLLVLCGEVVLTPKDQAFVEDLRDNATSLHMRNGAQNLIDTYEGRSMEKAFKDIEAHTGDIKRLNVGLAGTKVVVKRVQKDVKKQGKDIKQVKKDIVEVNERVDQVEEDLEETKERVEEIDKKTMSNAPTWSRDVTKLLNPKSDHDWRLLASRLGYSPDDIRGWATQSDPCMALLSEWYATHKTFEASRGVLNVLQEMNRLDAAIIVENAMKAAEGVVADEPVDYPEPPEIFLSYQWGHQNEVKLINRHLEMAGYKCWMDIGQMGGGDKLFEKIDTGIRAAKVIISCVTEKYAKSPNCNREVNLSVNLGKPMIPLLIEKMAWPPPGSMGPIFSEYLFIRFFQRPGEETKDDRFWPAPKFVELLMQLNCLKVMPDEKNVNKLYKNWWIPVVEEIVIPKKNKQNTGVISKPSQPKGKKDGACPEVFISYQWGKQKEISALYQKLTGLGLTCWMDIHQMGGGDSLYDKIDRGIRGCKVVVSSVTTKYSLSANCRREVSLADALKKPLIPMLMEKIEWPPSGPMSMVLTQLLYINFSKDESIQKTWEGKQFDELLSKIGEYVPLQIDVSTAAVTPNQETQKKSSSDASRKAQGKATEKPSSNTTPMSDTSSQVKKEPLQKDSAKSTNQNQTNDEKITREPNRGDKSSPSQQPSKEPDPINDGKSVRQAGDPKSLSTTSDVTTAKSADDSKSKPPTPSKSTDINTNQNTENNEKMPKSPQPQKSSSCLLL